MSLTKEALTLFQQLATTAEFNVNLEEVISTRSELLKSCVREGKSENLRLQMRASNYFADTSKVVIF